MSNNGYIRIPRSLLKDPLWKKLSPEHKEVFITILEYVCYFPQKFDDHGIIIDLFPGQFCASYREILALCGDDISKNHVERGIIKLEKCRFLRQEVRHTKSIITITHLDTYDLIIQASETTNETKLRQSRDTNKESKERKERKERKPPPSSSIKKEEKNGGGGFFIDEENDLKSKTANQKENMEGIKYKNARGDEKYVSDSEIYLHFLKFNFETKIIEKAVEEVKVYKQPISNIFSLIEKICERLSTPIEKEEIKPKRKTMEYEKTEKIKAKGVKLKDLI